MSFPQFSDQRKRKTEDMDEQRYREDLYRNDGGYGRGQDRHYQLNRSQHSGYYYNHPPHNWQGNQAQNPYALDNHRGAFGRSRKQPGYQQDSDRNEYLPRKSSIDRDCIFHDESDKDNQRSDRHVFNSPENDYERSNRHSYNSPNNDAQRSIKHGYNSPNNDTQRSVMHGYNLPNNDNQRSVRHGYNSPNNDTWRSFGHNSKSPDNDTQQSFKHYYSPNRRCSDDNHSNFSHRDNYQLQCHSQWPASEAVKYDHSSKKSDNTRGNKVMDAQDQVKNSDSEYNSNSNTGGCGEASQIKRKNNYDRLESNACGNRDSDSDGRHKHKHSYAEDLNSDRLRTYENSSKSSRNRHTSKTDPMKDSNCSNSVPVRPRYDKVNNINTSIQKAANTVELDGEDNGARHAVREPLLVKTGTDNDSVQKATKLIAAADGKRYFASESNASVANSRDRGLGEELRIAHVLVGERKHEVFDETVNMTLSQEKNCKDKIHAKMTETLLDVKDTLKELSDHFNVNKKVTNDKQSVKHHAKKMRKKSGDKLEIEQIAINNVKMINQDIVRGSEKTAITAEENKHYCHKISEQTNELKAMDESILISTDGKQHSKKITSVNVKVKAGHHRHKTKHSDKNRGHDCIKNSKDREANRVVTSSYPDKHSKLKMDGISSAKSSKLDENTTYDKNDKTTRNANVSKKKDKEKTERTDNHICEKEKSNYSLEKVTKNSTVAFVKNCPASTFIELDNTQCERNRHNKSSSDKSVKELAKESNQKSHIESSLKSKKVSERIGSNESSLISKTVAERRGSNDSSLKSKKVSERRGSNEYSLKSKKVSERRGRNDFSLKSKTVSERRSRNDSSMKSKTVSERRDSNEYSMKSKTVSEKRSSSESVNSGMRSEKHSSKSVEVFKHEMHHKNKNVQESTCLEQSTKADAMDKKSTLSEKLANPSKQKHLEEMDIQKPSKIYHRQRSSESTMSFKSDKSSEHKIKTDAEKKQGLVENKTEQTISKDRDPSLKENRKSDIKHRDSSKEKHNLEIKHKDPSKRKDRSGSKHRDQTEEKHKSSSKPKNQTTDKHNSGIKESFPSKEKHTAVKITDNALEHCTNPENKSKILRHVFGRLQRTSRTTYNASTVSESSVNTADESGHVANTGITVKLPTINKIDSDIPELMCLSEGLKRTSRSSSDTSTKLSEDMNEESQSVLETISNDNCVTQISTIECHENLNLNICGQKKVQRTYSDASTRSEASIEKNLEQVVEDKVNQDVFGKLEPSTTDESVIMAMSDTECKNNETGNGSHETANLESPKTNTCPRGSADTSQSTEINKNGQYKKDNTRIEKSQFTAEQNETSVSNLCSTEPTPNIRIKDGIEIKPVNEEELKIKNEPEWLKFGYTQEPDVIFLSDDDEMIMSFSIPVISLDSDSNDDMVKDNEVEDIKSPKLEKSDLDYQDNFSSPDDGEDQGSDFELTDITTNLQKDKNIYLQDTKIDFDNDDDFAKEKKTESSKGKNEERKRRRSKEDLSEKLKWRMAGARSRLAERNMQSIVNPNIIADPATKNVDKRYLAMTQVDNIDSESETDKVKLPPPRNETFIAADKTKTKTIEKANIFKYSDGKSGIKRKDLPKGNTQSKVITDQVGILKRPADMGGESKAVYFQEQNVKKPRLDIPAKKAIVIEPQKVKSTAEKRESAKSSSPSIPSKIAITELVLQANKDLVSVDANKSDMCLSKQSTKNKEKKTESSKGKNEERKRRRSKEDLSEELKWRMAGARSRLAERNMQSIVNPNIIADPATKNVDKRYLAMSQVDNIDSESETDKVKLPPPRNETFIAADKTKTKTIEKANIFKYSDGKSGIKRKELPKGNTQSKVITDQVGILKRPADIGGESKAVYFQEQNVKKPRLDIPAKKAIVIEPQKMKSTAEKRESAKSSSPSIPSKIAITELVLQANKDLVTVDANKSDMCLSKQSTKNKEKKTESSKGKNEERKRLRSKEDLSEELKWRMAEARSRLAERNMESIVNPNIIADPATKRMKPAPESTKMSKDNEVRIASAVASATKTMCTVTIATTTTSSSVSSTNISKTVATVDTKKENQSSRSYDTLPKVNRKEQIGKGQSSGQSDKTKTVRWNLDPVELNINNSTFFPSTSSIRNSSTTNDGSSAYVQSSSKPESSPCTSAAGLTTCSDVSPVIPKTLPCSNGPSTSSGSSSSNYIPSPNNASYYRTSAYLAAPLTSSGHSSSTSRTFPYVGGPSTSTSTSSTPETRLATFQKSVQGTNLMQKIPLTSTAISDRPPDRIVNKNKVLQWDHCLRVILKWSPNWFEERDKLTGSSSRYAKPPPVTNDLGGHDRHQLFPLVERYDSFDEYSDNFMLPLLLHETWENCYSTWREKKSRGQINQGKFIFNQQASAGEKLLLYTLQGLISENERRQGRFVNEGELIQLDVFGDLRFKEKAEERWYKIMGFVERVVFHETSVSRICAHNEEISRLRKPDSISIKMLVRIRLRSFFPKDNVLVYIQEIGSLINLKHQFQGLAYLPKSPLCRDLLFPTNSPTYCDKAATIITGLRGEYNESQSLAINTAANIASLRKNLPRICLLQGPPGTGKSHTIVGIITKIVQDTGGKCRICLCAPSNAAVDELLRRLHRENDKNKQDTVKLVRLGKKSSIHPDVQSLCLESLVQGNILKAHKEDMLRQLPQSLQGERKTLVKKIKETKEIIKTATEQFQSQKWETYLIKLERQQSVLDRKCTVDMSKIPIDVGKEKQIRMDLLHKANVVAGTLSSMGNQYIKTCFQSNIINQQVVFDCVIIDEATQAIELDTLIPLQYGTTKLILVGDPEQLPPTVLSQTAQENKFNMSLFERLDSHFKFSKNFNPVIFLDTQYRMDKEIMMFPNKYIYDRKLQNHQSVLGRQFPLVPYLLYDITEGKEQFSPTTKSISNMAEAKFTAELCKFIVAKTTVTEMMIGIIAPYTKQKELIVGELQQRGLKNIEVSTVDGFQGREKDVIVMSCVRANATGADRNRMNVSLTRAKHAMYLVGRFDSLQSSDEWEALISDAGKRKKIVSVQERALYCNVLFIAGMS